MAAADQARPGLTAANFRAVVNQHVLNPDLPADAADLERRLHRSLTGAADLAERLARGSLKGRRLAQLFPPLSRDVRALFATAETLQTRLYKARKQVPLSPRVGADPPGKSAAFALASLANRIVAGADGIVCELAWAAWEERAAREAEQGGWGQEDDCFEPDDDESPPGSADVEDLEETIDLGKLGEWLDFQAALASPAAADQLRKRFSGVTFPNPMLLLEEAGFELMELELDGPIAQAATITPAEEESHPGPADASTIDARLWGLLSNNGLEVCTLSKRQIAARFGCSDSTVGESKTWRRIMAVRKQQGKERQEHQKTPGSPKPGGRKRRKKTSD